MFPCMHVVMSACYGAYMANESNARALRCTLCGHQDLVHVNINVRRQRLGSMGDVWAITASLNADLVCGGCGASYHVIPLVDIGCELGSIQDAEP